MTPIEQHDSDQHSINVLAEAVTKAINDNAGNKRFLDLERIPLICLSISNISKAMDEMKEMMKGDREDAEQQHKDFITKNEFAPYKKALNTIAGLVLVAVVGGLLSLIFIK